jgi:hypothetical protein
MHLRIAQKCGRVKHLFIGLWLWCLTSLSTIFQLYGGGQFYWQGKLEYPIVKPAHAVTSIKQSPVLKGHVFLVLS